MRTSFKLLVGTALTAGSLAGFAGFAIAENYIVITHTAGTDPFWPVVQRGAEDAAAAVGATLDYRHPSAGDLVEMGQIVQAATAQNPDGIVVSIPDADILGGPIQAAIAAGIPVVSINSGADVADSLGVLMHVGQPEYEAGMAGGERAVEEGVTRGLCLNQEAFNVALEQRCQGYADGLGQELNMIDVTNDPAEIRARTSAAVSTDESIDGILAVGPHVCEAAVQALTDLGLNGQIHLGCFDLTPGVVEGIQNGDVAFAIDQQQYLQGYLPIIVLDLYNKYGLLPGSDVPSGPGFVTQENAAQVLDLAGTYR
ncbi:MAG: sugar ABC transporter substrate-binding protein [Alphaproteobacteria bacterium]